MALPEVLVGEILLRIPPADPAHFVRASLVCKLWRRLLADPAFLRRYRVFHRTPLFLGYFNDLSIPPFVPATPWSPPALDYGHWRALDCRHGRALIHTLSREHEGLLLWDPITGHQQHLPVPAYPRNSDLIGAVLCTAVGCDHLHCRGGPFLVVLLGFSIDEDEDDGIYEVWAIEYSSETGAWSPQSSIDLEFYVTSMPGVLTGGALYFTLKSFLRQSILKYDLGARSLSMMNTPEWTERGWGIATSTEDGGMGFAGVSQFKLYLWSWQARADGIAGWVQRRIIDLNELLPMDHVVPRWMTNNGVVGFIHGTNTIFISTEIGLFTFNPNLPKSRQVKKVGEGGGYHPIPYLSFYTPELAEAILPPS